MTESEIDKAAEEYVSQRCGRAYPGDGWDNNHRDFSSESLRDAFLAGAEHAKPRWVKCSERLPKEAMDVLALDAHGFARVVYWQTNDKWTDSEDGVSETQFRQWYTHWTTLPPAPEAESK